MAHQMRGVLEVAWTIAAGRPPRQFHDYPEVALQAILFHRDEVQGELDRMAARERMREHGPRRKGGKPTKWEEPLFTGDPLTDMWEAAIARGETPDLNAKVPGA